MNEDVNKFKATVKEITDNLETLCCVLDLKHCTIKGETVSQKLEIYENAINRLKAAFDTLRDKAGSKLIKDL